MIITLLLKKLFYIKTQEMPNLLVPNFGTKEQNKANHKQFVWHFFQQS